MISDYRQFINRDLPIIERGCTSKAAFDSRREAQHVARHSRHTDGSLRAYHCDYREEWHVGHARRRD